MHHLTFIAGQIFIEYALFLKEHYNTKVKGETTKLNRLVEAEARVTRLVNILSEDLKSIGCDLQLTYNEIQKLHETFYAVMTLDEVNQRRVMGLVNKLQKEQELKLETVQSN